MRKKIVILNGSPRVNGNTAALIAAFTKGAESKGHEVACFYLQKMNIHACLGCRRGGKDVNSPCVQKDDMEKIYPAYIEADVVVLASPLYYWNISGQLKCAIDRLFAVVECGGEYVYLKKDAVLLMAAGGKADAYQETLYYYERLMNHLGWKDRGKALADSVTDINDIAGLPILKEAEELGRIL